jgi:hypothetical protein
VTVRRIVTSRSGGVSTGPYASFNLGDHVGDDPAAVAANRGRLAGAAGERTADLDGAIRRDGAGRRRAADLAGERPTGWWRRRQDRGAVLVADCVLPSCWPTRQRESPRCTPARVGAAQVVQRAVQAFQSPAAAGGQRRCSAPAICGAPVVPRT